jgi:hypothetical protein
VWSVKKALVALLLATTVVFYSVPVNAKARMVAVFALRSTPEDAPAASAITKAIMSRIASLDGYDAVVPSLPSGANSGAAAAGLGAETYIVGQVSAADGAYTVRLGSFDAATDHAMTTLRFTAKAAPGVSDIPDLHELLGMTAASASTPLQTTTVQSGSTTGTIVPSGTAIHFAVASPISSSSAKVGDTFAIISTDELDIDGMVIVEKGAKGQGTIAMVEGAGSNGHAGKLGLQYDYVTASDGNKIKLSNTQHTDQGEGQAGKASTATVATYLLLGPLGLFAHNFVRGKDLTIDEKTKLTAFVDTSVHVNGARKAQNGAGYSK